ncbi:MAG TPA: tetratricopeptide repeat protein [Myxococcota bacterium]|nr:tetratricopeptide repeat protein [Myxococcota bacterium]
MSRAARAALAIAALTLLLYGRALGYGFVYDDWLHVVDEPVPEQISQVARIFIEPMSPLVPYYRPIPRLLNVAQKWLHGAAPLPFHALNLALGFACAWALRSVLASPALGFGARAATLGALIFLVHPLASECIAPITSGRETLLPTLFTLLAIAAYFRATPRGRAAAVACFALGLLSKEQAIVLPALLVLADGLRIAPDPPRGARAWLARYAPHVAVVVAYAALRALAIPADEGPKLALLSHPAGPLLSLLYDVQTTFAPFFAVVYEPALAAWWSWPRLAFAAVFASALLWLAFRADRRRALWLLALIALSLAPTANVLAQETAFAERWGFVALAGWAGLAALALRDRFERSRIAWAAVVAAGLAFGGVSAVRAGAYRDEGSFLAQWRASSPTSRQAWISTGEAAERRGDFDTAIAAYRRVLALEPDTQLAHASLAVALGAQGNLAAAQRHAERAVALDPRDAESWSNLGGIRARRGDLAGAVADYEHALALRPDLANAHNNLALALRARGDLAGARVHLEAALARSPQFAAAHANLGDLLAAQGDRAGAERHLTRALALDPELHPAREALARLRTR